MLTNGKNVSKKNKRLMRHFDKKILLFIEPCLSSYLSILKAKEKRYDTFVILSDLYTLPEGIINASSLIFIVNTRNDIAVLDLLKKISQKFYIDKVISGSEYYIPLAGKVEHLLKSRSLRS